MQWHEFLFSNSPKYRNRRHLLCWLLWWMYILFTIFITPAPAPPRNPSGLADFNHHQPGLIQLGYLQYCMLISIKSIILVLSHLLFCYLFIYIILPYFLSNKKYSSLITTALVACILMLTTGYFLYAIIYPFVDGLFDLSVTKANKNIVWASIDAGLLYAIKLTLVAVAIKLLKRQDVHVTDIALDVGFYSSQHFATTFKKLTGYTPSDFRKKNIPESE